MKYIKKNMAGFTLIELLVVISIMGILIALSFFSIQNARESARDGKRKSDLESIRSSVEIFRSDCSTYPLILGESLVGDDSKTSCLSSNTYIKAVPVDPISPAADYVYYSDGTEYEICAYLEQLEGEEEQTCNGSSSCGSSTCNYKVTNP